MYSCDVCTYVAHIETDLFRHNNAMHGGNFVCEKCDIVCTSRRDLGTHISNKHGPHYSTKYFSSQTRSAPKEEQKNARSKDTSKDNGVNHEDNTNETPAGNQNKQSEQQYPEIFKCKLTCSARQKSFSSDAELHLHNEYFHPDLETPSPLDNQ